MTVALRRVDAPAFRSIIHERERGGMDAASLDVERTVRGIVADVRARGDSAVLEWTARLDGIEATRLGVDAEQGVRAWESLDHELRTSLIAAAQRIRAFHELQVDDAPRGDATVRLRPEPLRRVGCYVPGGRAAYPSTVLMSVIPAQVAGVGSIAIASPPSAPGSVHPLVAAAAHLLGVKEVIAVGGAQAIAALAFGTESVAAVDKVVGPGNSYVTLAKREVFGPVGIDQLAGPSEILVIASDGADPELVAADLVSQLEHDPLAWAVCLTDSDALSADIARTFTVAATAAARSEIIAGAAGAHAMVVRCESLGEARALAERFAPEHVSLQGLAAERLRDDVRAAGAIFVGALSPVSIGDYVAGPSHTLPTQGAARHRGPLAVMDFVRWPSIVQLTAEDFDIVAPVACNLARAEGLHAHETAIRARMRLREASS